MKKKIGALLGAAAILLALVPTARADQINVWATDNAFNSNAVNVPVGSTVTWTNTGMNPHTVTADDGLFDSGTLNPNATYSYTFNTPGTYPYYCRFHGGPGGVGMAGIIVVTDTGGLSATQPYYSDDPSPLYYGSGTSPYYYNPPDQSTYTYPAQPYYMYSPYDIYNMYNPYDSGSMLYYVPGTGYILMQPYSSSGASLYSYGYSSPYTNPVASNLKIPSYSRKHHMSHRYR